jgi:riboflavin kinase / FMN adenylyltransferase
MQTVHGLSSPSDSPPAAVALGVFDGVHLGHRAILETAVRRAHERGLAALACTFDPHPLEILQPERAPIPVTTLPERLELIAATGIETTVVLPFTAELARIEPESFVKDILVGRLRAREIVVGFNHRFGHRARGDTGLLERLGDSLGFGVRVVPPLTVDGRPVSSTAVRAALQRGDLAATGALLGRAYDVRGTVVHGDGRGRTLGFPTANVQVDRPLLLPLGVYACRAEIAGEAHGAVVNVGMRPTFGATAPTVEAHLLDFAGDIYRERIRLTFVDRIREERKFPSVEALVDQIRDDAAAARLLL